MTDQEIVSIIQTLLKIDSSMVVEFQPKENCNNFDISFMHIMDIINNTVSQITILYGKNIPLNPMYKDYDQYLIVHK